MPENIVVTLKTEKPGGLWPFVRNTFALIGFGAVVAGLSVLDSPNPQGQAVRMIEAVGEGLRAFDKANPYGNAPSGNRFDDIDIPALPDNSAEKRSCPDG